jgi:hypothetical protein
MPKNIDTTTTTDAQTTNTQSTNTQTSTKINDKANNIHKAIESALKDAAKNVANQIIIKKEENESRDLLEEEKESIITEQFNANIKIIGDTLDDSKNLSTKYDYCILLVYNDDDVKIYVGDIRFEKGQIDNKRNGFFISNTNTSYYNDVDVSK